ncbi:hypothetical protein [Bacillus sp. CHD6a]|uniref:hypothetical protein n=1 Tax=Bacillus sp. CHD6a TaxID=1643452 RepID=UPI00076184C9|nr:hypothetical protein [Bacillus sp. CHD6a]
MLSNKFKEAVMAQDITRVRLMMKDSLTMDLTFRQFQEMLDFAVSRIPGLIEVHDGTTFEGKSSWNKDYASDLKVDLIDNFSSQRIAHIKDVQRFVYADKIVVEKQYAAPETQAVQVAISPTREPSQHNQTYPRVSGQSQSSSRNMDSSTMATLIPTLGVAAVSILFGVIRNAAIVKIATTTIIATCVIGGITYYLVKK